ncbi:MAG TPA: hypothetical protein VH276_19205 [Solirubrobacteraceae bacterium]|nr:hypothetical protein [Solirubrobacteraceae bacterium]
MTVQRLAVPAGLGTALVLAFAVGLAVRLGAPQAASQAPGRTPVVAGGDDLASLRQIDRIALRQTRRASHQLAGCAGAERVRASVAGMVAWRRCARWPLAHVSVDGRMNGTILYEIGQRLESVKCRAFVVGRANTLRLMAADADQLVRAIWDTSSRGRYFAANGLGSITGFLRTMRHDIARSGLGPCERGLLATSA